MTKTGRPLIDRITPRASARVQLFSAAVVWAVGAGILITRGVIYVHDRSWHAWLLGASLALVIAIPKSRYVLSGVAHRAVARILERDHACYFGFFSWKSWLFVMVMMGGGIFLRSLVVRPGVIGAGIMGALYLGIGSALLFADRHFWHAAVRTLRHLPAFEEDEDPATSNTPQESKGDAE